ncbi:MAG: cbb3-type cytochrome c oxidase subunit I [Thermoprotei archaeon]
MTSRGSRRPNLLTALFQWDKEWESRVFMVTLVFAVVWFIVGAADALLVRLQESTYGLLGTPVTTPWSYYAGLTLHAERMLFGFAQQLEMGIFVFLTVKLLGVEPRGKWMIWSSIVMINASIFLFEGPVILSHLSFIDSYFSATGWDSLSPLGVPGYSSYVVSPLWWWGWLALEASTFLWGAWTLYTVARSHKKLNYVMYYVLGTVILYVMGYAVLAIATNWELLAYYIPININSLYDQFIFWFYGHSIVYMLFLPAVTALYFLVPTLMNREIFSDRLAKVAAILYVAFSNIVPIHHLYNAVFPYYVNILQEVMTYGVVVPSMMTFFNLWATAKGVKNITWSVPAAFTVMSFAGAIAAGVTGVANATVSFDSVIHNSMWVPAHFHAMIMLMIVPGAYALLYVLVTWVTHRLWYSVKLAWAHFWLTLVGSVGFILFFSDLGVSGVLRRSMIYPRINYIVVDEIGATVFAVLVGFGALAFVLNTLQTIFRGRVLDLSRLNALELVSAAAASTVNGAYSTPEPPTVKIERRLKQRAEYTWVIVGVLLLALTAVTTLPEAVYVGGAITNVPKAYFDPPVENVTLIAHQYYWNFTTQNTSTLNFFVVNPGEKVLLKGTVAKGNGLANFYMPLFSDRVVDYQLYQEYYSYVWFTAPTQPGVYGFMNGEYNGPFYTYMGGEMIVMPPAGVFNTTQLESYLDTTTSDVYTPPISIIHGAVTLTMSGLGNWNDSVPAPTLVAQNGSLVNLTFEVNLNALTSYSNYVFNITQENTTKSVQTYLSEHGGRLPFSIELLHIAPNGEVSLVGSMTPTLGVNTLSFRVKPGVYVYGVLQPISYEFNPYGLSNNFNGYLEGYITALWGTILVIQP